MAETRLEASLEMQVDQAIRALRQFRQQLGTEVPKAATQATQGLKKFEAAAANAQPTLVNFGRVVQDAPFGLIGIANNIDPLVTSFQTLKAQTGSASAAFKALGASLLGPAGVAIGVSAITSALIAFGPEIAAAIGSISEFDKIQREAAEGGAKAFKAAQIEFQGYVDTINDGNNSTERQKDALDDANKALDNYGLKIKDIASFQKNAGEIGLLYAEIKKLEAQSNVLAAKSAEEYAKRVAIITEVQQNDGVAIAKRIGFLGTLNAILGNVGSVYSDINQQLVTSAAAEKNLDKENQNLRDSISALVQALKAVPGVVEDFGKKLPAKSLADLRKELDNLYAPDDTRLRQTLTFTSDQYTKQFALIKAINAEIDKRKKKEQGESVSALVDAANGGAIAQVANTYKQIPAAIQQAIADNKTLSDETKKNLLDTIDNVLAGFNVLNPLIDQTFNALANGENVFDSLRQGVKRLIVDLIKAAALAAILSAIPGGAAGATGLTAVIGKLLNFKGFRAGGGPVQSGGSYIVGEKGPELFVPENGGRIIPNSALMNGGGAMGGVLTARVEGSDLLFILERAQRSAGRRR